MAQKRILSAKGNSNADADIFQINNFIFTDTISPPKSVSLGTDFVFNGMSVLICLEGECTVKINYSEYVLKKNQILIVMPYRIVSMHGHSEDCSITGFFLGVEYYTKHNISGPDYEIIIRIKGQPLVTLTDEQMRCLMELHSVIRDRYRNMNNPYSTECLNALIFSFMAEIKCLYEHSKSEVSQAARTRQEQITDDFFRLLVSNFKEDRSVAFYADKLCFTPKYLSAVVKKVTGYTIQEWVNEMVINHTKSLLKTTDKTVLEISEEMHFSNPSFFGRFFKQYTGMTPMQFRRR